ncbi:MAG: tyrosine-protein phosphatase [Bacilli bacterium]|nr:tyrosine-protein phosphatase [Bacilli bacterium]
MKKIKHLLLLSVSASMLIACGGGKTPSTPESSEPESQVPTVPTVENPTITEVTTFDEPQSLYTEKQKAFLRRSGEELAQMTQAQAAALADGKSNLSSPEPVKLTWENEEQDGLDHYEVSFYSNYDFENPITINAGKEKSANIYNLAPGSYHYQVKGIYEDGSQDESEYFPVELDLNLGDGTYGTIRNWHVDGITNCRDLGGTPLAGGGTFKYGMLYRTSSFADYNMDKKKITAEGIAVVETWGLKTEIELRGGPSGTGGESTFATATTTSEIPGVEYKFCPWAYQNGKNLIYRNLEPLRKVFDVLGDPDNYPCDFHCRIGTDRTGAVALLVNGLLGVSLDDIYKDYMFSNFGNIGKTTYVNQTNEDSTRAYVDALMTWPGEKFHNKVYNFLSTVGVPTEKLDMIIELLTDGDQVTGNDKKVIVVDGNKAESAGAKTTKTDVRGPETYTTLAKNQTATYKFNLKEAVEGKVFVNMKLASGTHSAKLSTIASVKVNGETKALSQDLPIGWQNITGGLGLVGDYWIPVELTSDSFDAGEVTVTVEALTANLLVSQATILPNA